MWSQTGDVILRARPCGWDAWNSVPAPPRERLHTAAETIVIPRRPKARLRRRADVSAGVILSGHAPPRRSELKDCRIGIGRMQMQLLFFFASYGCLWDVSLGYEVSRRAWLCDWIRGAVKTGYDGMRCYITCVAWKADSSPREIIRTATP